MKIISHRGHENGSDINLSNKPDQIILLFKKKFEIEIDLWAKDDFLYLGHDFPEFKINLDFLMNMKNNLWIHCKNFESLNFLQDYKKELNFFWHDTDDYTITSKGYPWIYPNKPLIKNGIEVVLSKEITLERINSKFPLHAICSDFILFQ